MTEGRVGLNGSGPQTIYMNTYRNSQSQAGNYSNYRSYGVYEGQGWGSWINSAQYWSASGGGMSISGSFTIPSPGTGSITLYDHWWNRGHDANGYGSGFDTCFSVDTSHSTIGDGTVCVSEGAPPRIPKIPGKPPTPVFVKSLTTSIEYSFTSPSDNGGSGLTNYNHQVSTDSGFSNIVKSFDDASSTATASPLTPGTKHWFRYRAVNAIGAGPWSDSMSATTLPAVPPGLTVTASPSGQAATLTFTPPGGVTGVRQYDWERRLQGTTSPVSTGSTTTTVDEVGGLTPGLVYEWRGTAWIEDYESPATGWIALQQPSPNVNPGDYFDGSTTDTPDLDYGWTGTVDNSVSQAVASAPTGWELSVNSGAAIVIRATAGLFGPYSARVVFSADTTAAGQHFGQGWTFFTEVTENADYVGSIYVRPSRAQHLAAMLIWMDGANSVLGTTTGTPVEVASGSWVRLMASATAPPGAHRALVRATDVAGTGWSVWHGGDTVDLDGAMISLNEEFPYFDGDFTDTSEFVYEWVGTPNASVSTRTPVGAVSSASAFDSPDLLAGCVVPPKPPRPPSIPSDCITNVGVWRRYYVEIPSDNVSDWLSGVLTLHVISGAYAANQVRIRVYPNPTNADPSEVNVNEWCAEQIISYMPAKTTMTLDGVTQRAWAEVNGGAPQSADHLLYGTGGTPATWPILSCGISYLVSLEVPIAAPEGNIDALAFLTTRT